MSVCEKKHKKKKKKNNKKKTYRNSGRFSLIKVECDFWGSPNLLVIKCEIQHDFSWSKNCIISDIFNTPEIVHNAANLLSACAPPTPTTSALIKINSAKINGPVVTLFINETIKFLKEFKRKFSWNKLDLKLHHNQKGFNLDYMLALSLNVNANDNDHFREKNNFEKY